MKKLITIAAMLMVILAGGLYREDIVQFVDSLAVNSAPPASSAPAVEVIRAPATRVRLVCIDPTGSTASSFAEAIKASFILTLSSYLPPKPTETKYGVNPSAGLDLSVRLVTTAPLEYGAPFYRVQVPGVPGLPPRIDMTQPGALSPDGPYSQWKEAEAQWSVAYDQAYAAVQAGVATLQSIDLSIREWSGVTACMSGLAAIAPSDGDVSFLLASDLEETVAPETTGAFGGHDILVIQPTDGSAATADSLFNSFAAWASAQGAGTISQVRPEIASPAIEAFLNGSN